MAKTKISDDELIALFREDKRHAEKVFSLLMQKYTEALYYQIRKITRNHEETNDVLQNVWIKVWKNLGDFKQESSLFTWLFRIARNESLNFLQKEKRHRSVDADDNLIEILAGHHVLDNFSEDQVQESLMKAIASLPDKQALVFNLKFFDDLKYSEMSQQLNTSEGALKASYHIAVKKIQEILLHEFNLHGV